jgi:hypothetical protein
MISTAYGDSFKAGVPPPTSVYVHHVDSNERESLLRSTPSTYTVKLGANLQRVCTIQVGDVQLPAAARWTIDQAHRHLGVSEPLKLDVATVLSIQESTATYDLRTGAQIGPTTTRAGSMTFPPTVLTVIGIDSDNVTLSENHGMDAVLALWPEHVPPPVFFGTRTRNYDVRVTPSNTLPTTTPNKLEFTTAFVAEVEANLAGTATSWLDVFGSATGAAGLYVTPLTLPEWVRVLQDALDIMTASGSLARRYALALNAETGLVELSYEGSDALTPSTRTETTVTVTVVRGDAMWQLGFPPGTWTLPAFKNPRFTHAGVRTDVTPFVTRVQPRAVRTVQLRRGRYCRGDDLAAELTRACSPLTIPATTPCTFVFHSVLGAPLILAVPAGRYTPAQLALCVQSRMNTLAFASTPAFVVTPVQRAGAGGFLISDASGRLFALDFTATAAAPIAAALGFDPVFLGGAARFESTREAFCGQSTALPFDPDVSSTLTWTATPLTGALQVASSRAFGVATATVAALSASPAILSCDVSTATIIPTELAPHLAVNDLVRVSDSAYNSVLVRVARAPSGDETTSVNHVRRTDLDLGALVSGDISVDLGDELRMTPVGRPDVCLHFAPPPSSVRFPGEDVSGASLLNSTLAKASAEIGTGAAYGPLFEQLGFAPTTVQTSTAGQFVAPGVMSLEPPPYVMLALLAPSIASERSVFRPSRCDAPQPVLAKFIVTGGYARISEESTHVSLTSPLTVSSVTVAWLNPDGTLVDWNGVNHSYSLLFRVVEGKVHGAAVD